MKINEECEIIGHDFKPRYETRRHKLEIAENEWAMILLVSLITIVAFPFALAAYYFAGKDRIYVCDVCVRCGLRSDKQ